MAGTTAKARKTPKRTAPRKAAQARAKTNGHQEPAAAPTTEGFNTPPLTVMPPPPEPTIQHPYGDKPVYVFKPADGNPPIIFPKISTVEITTKFMWKIYDLAEIFQSFEWMNLAGVPREIQERVVDLPINDRQRFWSGWFNDVTQPLDLSAQSMGPPGES